MDIYKLLNPADAVKICPKCEEEKTLDSFSKNRRTKDGRQVYCKKCKSTYQKVYRKTPAGRETQRRNNRTPSSKAARKRYIKSDKGKESVKRYYQSDKGKQTRKRYDKRHRNRVRAREAVRRALKRGDLVRPNKCPECNRTDLPIESHHPSYKKKDWLNIEWQCSECHDKKHWPKQEEANAKEKSKKRNRSR